MDKYEEYVYHLGKSKFLEGAPDHVLREVANIATEVSIKAGELLFRKGDMGDSMYVVLSGRVRVHDGDLILRHLGAGHVLGEIASLGSVERTASVTSEEDTSLLEINSKALFRLLSDNNDFAEPLVAMLCRREKSMVSKITNDLIRVKTLERELEIGRQIQSGFLPTSLPEIPGWNISAYFKAAREVAGDFYDAFTIKSLGHTCLVVGDVCDKGVGAALFMTLFRSLIRASALSADFHNWSATSDPVTGNTHEGSLDEAVEECLGRSIMLTNNYIARTHSSTHMFASVFMALLDPNTGTLHYINGGHEAPVIFSPNNIKQRLDTTGPVVGIFPDSKYRIARARMAPGDILLAFTDGITEARAVDGSQYSVERLLKQLESHTGSPNGLIDNIMSSLNKFTDGTSQYDDNTLLAVSCKQE